MLLISRDIRITSICALERVLSLTWVNLSLPWTHVFLELSQCLRVIPPLRTVGEEEGPGLRDTRLKKVKVSVPGIP